MFIAFTAWHDNPLSRKKMDYTLLLGSLILLVCFPLPLSHDLRYGLPWTRFPYLLLLSEYTLPLLIMPSTAVHPPQFFHQSAARLFFLPLQFIMLLLPRVSCFRISDQQPALCLNTFQFLLPSSFPVHHLPTWSPAMSASLSEACLYSLILAPWDTALPFSGPLLIILEPKDVFYLDCALFESTDWFVTNMKILKPKHGVEWVKQIQGCHTGDQCSFPMSCQKEM